jgi:hypothetical protein
MLEAKRVFSRSRLVDVGIECLCGCWLAGFGQLPHAKGVAFFGQGTRIPHGFDIYRYNQAMGRRAWVALASGLRRNSSLEHLKTHDMFLGKNQLQDLLAALEENKSLKTFAFLGVLAGF